MEAIRHMADTSARDSSDETTALQSAAATYAQHGVAIFPVRPRGKTPALPRCPDATTPDGHKLSKQALADHAANCPRDGHGFHDATTDLDTIQRWWTDRPDANIGIALGANGLLAIDVDGPEGRATLTDLEDTYQPLPPTYEVITGRAEGSGRHYIFRQLDDKQQVGNVKLGDHLETRGAGGYVVAPPSIHETGRPYVAQGTWTQISDAPEWLVAVATRARTQPADPGPDLPPPSGTDDLARRRLDGAAGKVALAPEGERNNVLNWAAYTAGQLVGAGRLDRKQAEQALTVAAQRAGLTPSETAATIASGLDAGIQDPDHATATALTDVPAATPLEVPTARPNHSPDDPTPATSWAPVDGTSYIDGTWTPPTPTQLVRNDRRALFYDGRINLLFGESEAGKGWVALHAVAQALDRGDAVLYIDFEDYADTIYTRLKLLGARPTPLAERFAYIRPDTALDDNGRQALGDTVTTLTPQLVILDGVTGAMSLHGLDTNSSTDVDQFYNLLGEPLARTGAAVIFIDHVTKSSETRGKGPIGSQHKRARVSGASYEVSTLQALAPGRDGKLHLKIDKDRLGAIRSTHPTSAGVFRLDSTDPDRAHAVIYAPTSSEDEEGRRLRQMMVRISAALQDAGDNGLSIRGINEVVSGGRKETIRDALDELVNSGHVVREPGPNRSLIHRISYPFIDGPTTLENVGVPVSPSVPLAPGTPVAPRIDETGGHVPRKGPKTAGVPRGVPVSPSVPLAPGTPVAAQREGGVPVSPAFSKAGTGDTHEPGPKQPTGTDNETGDT